LWFNHHKGRKSRTREDTQTSRIPETTNDKQRRIENAENEDLVEIHRLFYDEN
jgi:hypothetical protein